MSGTPITDRVERNFGEMPGEMRKLERQLAAAQVRIKELEADKAAIIEFCKTEMGWEFFRAEFEIEGCGQSAENARKLQAFLNRNQPKQEQA